MTSRLKKALSVKEIAAITGTCDETVRRWCRQGKLPWVRIGPKLIRIPEEAAMRLIEGKNPMTDK